MTALCCVFLIPLPALPAPLEPHFEERQGLTRLVTRSPQPLRGQARSQAEPVPESVRRWPGTSERSAQTPNLFNESGAK